MEYRPKYNTHAHKVTMLVVNKL